MANTKTVEAGELETQNGVNEKTLTRYVDMTPTWVGILPVLLETKDHPESAQELEKMAKLADRLNTPLHKSASDMLEALKGALEYFDSPPFRHLHGDMPAKLTRVTIGKAEGRAN